VTEPGAAANVLAEHCAHDDAPETAL
jgi:hypothetical protein